MDPIVITGAPRPPMRGVQGDLAARRLDGGAATATSIERRHEC